MKPSLVEALARLIVVIGGTYGAYAHDELYVRPHTDLVPRLPDILDPFGLDRKAMVDVARGRAGAASH